VSAPTTKALVTGWGGTPRSLGEIHLVHDEDQVAQAIREAGRRGVLARGAGRAYGDAAMNAGGALLDLSNVDHLRTEGDRITVGAGAVLNDVIDVLLAQGLFVPVSPGTSFVTFGGLIAADVHGKNHHRSGSWGHHVESLRIVDGLGIPRTLTPDGEDAEHFWATVGGMGLTGVVTELTFRAIPVSSPSMSVTTTPYDALEDVMYGLRQADETSTYSVAWIDSVGASGRLGRGIVSTGEHASDEHASDEHPRGSMTTRQRISVPVTPPLNLLGRASISLFNEIWMRISGRPRIAQTQPLRSFFYPLDGVGHWNRLYGPAGFVQYQVVVPDHAAEVIGVILSRLKQVGSPSFLSVLKRFGSGNPGPLSFPEPGWTLALDLPAGNPALGAALDALDGIVLEAGGRHYLAKDARASAEAIRRGYPRLADWERVRSRMDPGRVFASDLARRLRLGVDTAG